MEGEALPAVLILTPVFFAFLATASKSHSLRKIVTYAGAFIMVPLSILLWTRAPIAADVPAGVYPLVLLIDYLLFGYFLYQGVIHRNRLVISLTLLQFALMFILTRVFHVAAEAPVLLIDGLSSVMVLITGIVGSVILVYSTRYMEAGEDLGRENRFLGAMFLFLGSMNALVFSNNVEWIFFFYELTTLSSYYLIQYRGDRESIDNSLQALWMNQIGGYLC